MEGQQFLFESCISALERSLDHIDNYLPDNEKQPLVSTIREIAKDYCNIDHEYKNSLLALQKTERDFNSEDLQITKTVTEIYDKYLEEMSTEQEGVDHTTHPVWTRITSSEGNSIRVVEASQHDETPVTYEVLNDSMMCSQMGKMTLDPITKKDIVNPCKSNVCGHVYEYDTIMVHIRNGKRTGVVCPYLGCQNKRLVAGQIVRS